MVKWLERLGYGAEGWALPCDHWKTLSVNPAINGYLFRIREVHLSSAVPKIQWDSNTHCPYGY